MPSLKIAVAEEQPKINAVLEAFLQETPPLTRPVAEHILKAGGKRLRPLLTLLAGRAFGCRSEDLYTLGAAVEMLHAATLLHDDILDGADLRRGRPSAHTLFGVSNTILAGHALLSQALIITARLNDSRLTRCISEAVMHTSEGELAEFAFLRNVDLTHENYLKIIEGKTAWMLRASCELGALRAEAGDDAVEAAASFGTELGIAFQMVDDALDFYPSEMTGKPAGGDLREGKVTPPLLLRWKSLPEEEAARERERFRESALTEAEAARIGDAIYAEGFAAQTRELADGHLKKAAAALALFPDGKERGLLYAMTDYVRNRTR